ncbi:hypothetical protein PBY51_013901 [Eleginops maclovinus]|uniref:Uncharacterized protein n=1 Tax=Eleginops maclovinus TaxID=56733 RepID=A0AAN7WVM2_ELEMC|nr:hypothetical protein PBY51_013901 [Eleginops maclovinus]
MGVGPLAPGEVGSAPPPSTDQSGGSSTLASQSKWGDELCNLDVSKTSNCLLSQPPKMDPSGAADYIKEEDSLLFSEGAPDKRVASVPPFAIWSRNHRRKKKEPRNETAFKMKSLLFE